MLSTKIIRVIFIWSLVVLQVQCEFSDCPRFCKCDVYKQLNRAECSSRRLISAEVEIPNVVQILDFSYNDITMIEDNTFKPYTHLKYLDLSHNAIYTLELESFSRLRRILEIDLSYNRLQYLDERLFERNHHLHKLNLEGNKFISIGLRPLIKSTSLMELNLRNTQIAFVHNTLFSKLTNLIELDLSQNLVNTLRMEDFMEMTKLKSLQLSENSIRCDKSMRQKLQQMEDKGIKVYMDECKSFNEDLGDPAEEKFQKMVVIPQTMEAELDNTNQRWRFNVDDDAETSQEDGEIYDYHENPLETNDALLSSNEWLRFAPDTVLCEPQKFKLCQSYRKCLENLNSAWHGKHSSNSFSSSEAKFGFFLGVACGVTSVICLLTCALCLKNCCETKRKVRDVDLEEPFEISAQPLARTTQQLPPQVRRQSRRRAAPPPPPRAVVRYEGPVGENFISRLFGRPARHQYYRTINQNTATLIRRLSRSNLFNNRLSQHILDRQFSNEPSAESEVNAPSAPRPETPPPCYGDVVVDECTGRSKRVAEASMK